MSVPPLASAAVCRGCLARADDMVSLSDRGLLEDFYSFADVPVVSLPGVGDLVCAACEAALAACRRFRAQCQRAARLLLGVLAKVSDEKDNEVSHDQGITILTDLSDRHYTVQVQTSDKTSKINLPCPFRCGCSYLKQSDLLLHLKRTHKLAEDFTVDVRYHCPFEGCGHNINAAKPKPFNGRKYLNQHLLKVHSERSVACGGCGALFRSQGELGRHARDCNLTFMCFVCESGYRSRESLLVHLKRRHPDTHAAYKDGKRVKPDAPDGPGPRRTSGTQTPDRRVRNDVLLSSGGDRLYCSSETQTALDAGSPRSDDDLFFDIQTQTFDVEFGLSRNLDGCIKETQTDGLGAAASCATQTGDS